MDKNYDKSANNDDDLPLEKRVSHVSACADQNWNQARNRQHPDKDESGDVSSTGEYGIPDRSEYEGNTDRV